MYMFICIHCYLNASFYDMLHDSMNMLTEPMNDNMSLPDCTFTSFNMYFYVLCKNMF